MGDKEKKGSGSKLQALGDADQSPSDGVKKCTKPIHWVGVRLRYKDDLKDVPAADCVIHNGDNTLNPGPLAAGKLQSKKIVSANYEVSFPNIHADEWAAE